MICTVVRIFLALLLIPLFQSNLFAISIDAKIPDQTNRNVNPGSLMTFTPCVSGMAGPYPCNKIDLLSFVPIASMGCTGNGNVVEGWVDPLDGKEYALMGCANGVSFLNVTDPLNPIYLGRLPTQTTNSLWRDVRVYNNRAYVGCDVSCSNHGIQVFDLTRLRGVITPQTFTNDAHYNGLSLSHTIFINQDTGFLYAVGSSSGGNPCASGLHMINVQNLVPTFAGCFGSPTYTHEVTCVTYDGPDNTYDGKEVCFAANGPTQQIVISDVTNKSAPVQLSATGYPGASYPHQVWLTEDHTYLLLNDELDEGQFDTNTTTYIWNISDLNAPILIDNYVHQTDAIDHNLYIKDNFAYESNYEAGLRIMDLTNVSTGQLSEVAFFDVWPYAENPDSPEFEGSWDNYPFLPSGVILVSGIFNPPNPNPANVAGLFILQPTLAPDFLVGAEEPVVNACGTGSGETTIDVTPRFGYTGNVTLSALSLPSGATAGFSPNPVSVPGNSLLTVNLSGTPPGNYPFDVQGTDGTITHTSPLTLNVASSVLSAPTLLHPPNNSIDETFVIHYEWNPVAGASSYDLEVATDSNFNNVIYSVTEVSDHHTGILTLDPVTQYWWRTRTNNACGASAWSAVFTFTTAAPANILLVDDDNNAPDVLSFYQDAVSFAGQTFDVWDTSTQEITNSPQHADEPDAATMSNYQMVVWFSGDSAGGSANPKAGPSESAETSLSQYLNAGGCFFLSSEEYFSDRGGVLSPFMSGVLGVQSMNNNVNMTNVTGNGIFNGVGSFTLQYPAGLSNLSDRVVPNTSIGAQVAFSGNQGNAAISRDSGTYRTVFLGFPFEAIPTQAKRREVLQKAIDYCLSSSCPTINLSPSSLPSGTQGTAYNQTITASGGTAPYSFAVTSGTLPTGLSLSSAGVLSGTPVSSGTSNFNVTATDSNDCTGTRSYSITIVSSTCLFCDDFEDGILPTDWAFKQPWSEDGDNLVGVPNGKKAVAIASPAFDGCINCTVQTTMRSAGGTGNKLWFLAWYFDKGNKLELLMNQEKGRWILKQRANNRVVAKQKAILPINANQFYDVQITFTGTQFEVRVDGVLAITMNSGASVQTGTVGYQVRDTTGSFGNIAVN